MLGGPGRRDRGMSELDGYTVSAHILVDSPRVGHCNAPCSKLELPFAVSE